MTFRSRLAAALAIFLLADSTSAFAKPLKQPSVRTQQSLGVSSFHDANDTTSISPPWGGGSNLVSVARQYMGTNPTGRKSLWCADFLNLVLRRSGREGTSSSMARSFAGYGRRLAGPQVGAIAVLARGKGGGHVGIVTGIDSDGNPTIISGNHGNRVAEGTYPRGRVIAYVLPAR
jgi:uncharacterized protein (TIGR02594 family)